MRVSTKSSVDVAYAQLSNCSSEPREDTVEGIGPGEGGGSEVGEAGGFSLAFACAFFTSSSAFESRERTSFTCLTSTSFSCSRLSI